jgi:hypothetical protein
VPVACPMSRSEAVSHGHSRCIKDVRGPAVMLARVTLCAHSQADSAGYSKLLAGQLS